MAHSQVLEGTREDIIALLKNPETAGRWFRLIVMSEEEPISTSSYQPDAGHLYFTATREEFNMALDALAEKNRDLPILPPEAFERESIYEDNFR